jgi:arsenate reductase
MLGFLNGELRRLFNVSGRDYRDMKMKERLPTMTEQEALSLLSQNGNLIKRPFLLGDSFGLVGFDPGAWSGIIADTRGAVAGRHSNKVKR